MIIELCGVPGAGKSHLTKELAQELRRAGQQVELPLEPVSPRCRTSVRLLRKLGWASRELVTHPVASALAVRAVSRSAQGSIRTIVVRSLNLVVLRSCLRRARGRHGTHIVDQGLIQELGSLAYCGDGEAAMGATDPGPDRLAPDVILVVDVDIDVADRRLDARAGTESRIERAGTDRRAQLDRQEHLLSGLLDSWIDRFGAIVPTRVHRVDNSTDGSSPDLTELVAAVSDAHRRKEVLIP